MKAEDKKKEYLLRIAGIEIGKHTFSMTCDKAFFEISELYQLQDGEIKVQIEMEKTENMMDMRFHFRGKVAAQCDRCLDLVELALDFDEHLVVNLVPTDEKTSTEDDNIWMINENDSELDLFHFIYESILLSLPQQITHPEIDGKPSCNPEMIKILDNLSNRKPETDPRWEALKNIKLD